MSFLPRTRIGWLNLAAHIANGAAMAAPFIPASLLPERVRFAAKFLPGVTSAIVVYVQRYRDKQAAELAAKNAYVWPVPGETYTTVDGPAKVKNHHESDD